MKCARIHARKRHVVLTIALIIAAGCRQEMYDQPRGDTFEATPLFDNGTWARTPPPQTIPRDAILTDDVLLTGKRGTNLANAFPFRIERRHLERGRESYDVYCRPCHGATGDGNGIIPQRGFPAPPSFHETRLRSAPVGHFYDVIGNGFGVMYSYASRVPVTNRWEIAAYIRALQLSRNARLEDVPPEDRVALDNP
jgi:hypothetical protein